MNRIIIKLEENEWSYTLYEKDRDESEFYETIKFIGDGNYAEFIFGNFDVLINLESEKSKLRVINKMIKETEKEIEELKSGKQDEKWAIVAKEEFIKYLKEDEKKIKNAEDVEEIIIDYYPLDTAYMNITFNDKTIKINSGERVEIIFKNMEIEVKDIKDKERF